MNVGHKVKEQAKSAAHEVAPWIERLARFGYVCKGVIYGTVGVLALRAAFDAGRVTDQRGALARLGDAPFGQFLLVVLGLGLIGYALWQLVRAVLDPEHQGHGAKGIVKRIGFFLSAIAYVSLALYAMGRAGIGASRSGGGSQDEWTAQLMARPFGEWLVALIGLGVLAVAGNQLYVAYKALFMKRIDVTGLDPKLQDGIRKAGRVGIAARGTVFGLLGVFLIQAAWTNDPSKAGGLADALRELERAPVGPWLLVVVALGVIAYGAYAVAQGRYRRIRVA
ncbi:DUF1206 domain-containing protein [Deinococcus yavapaiensis]|uniref:Uncharacterized protein DUF1206 n=1 Tax=Deinococcus yavapaiensis KR-236 TaxID=694435 RepID=A0A318SAQ2_9DEIO|nr:DUF1206 domain-containing protein [Deinococcus yavapaiensis]PYE56449.1 uncharacterized protein DUF1206 [Deinococcus yavapaiensis KR-236]